MIKIINYGGANLENVLQGFQKFSYSAQIVSDPNDLFPASGIVLPGVGAFRHAMATLQSTHFDKAIKEGINKGIPFLGICLGLQLLFEDSEEFGLSAGLGILKGHVLRFKIEDKVPHIGWNQIEKRKDVSYLANISDGSYFYFVHSYYVKPTDDHVISTTTTYGHPFVSSVQYENIFATQFHPEKSQKLGLEIIHQFGKACV